MKAVGLALFGYFLWPLHDTVIKLLTEGYSTAQILFFGRLLSVPVSVGLILYRQGVAGLGSKRPWLHAARGALSIVDMILFVSAIALTSLANAITISFASPLIMTALSVMVLGERVNWKQWLAVAAGFLGVVIVFQPSAAGFGPASVYAFGSAVAYAVFLIFTRAMTRTESIPSMMFWNSSLVMLAMGVMMMPDWKTPVGDDLWLFVYLSFSGVLAQYVTTAAFRYGEASLLAPIQYTALVWAAIAGYLVFGDVPSGTLWVGAAVIMAATLYVIRGEAAGRRARRRARRLAEAAAANADQVKT
jgi:drug/metabolite transporter (DMT)-like permease